MIQIGGKKMAKKILIVDDEEIIREAVKLCLQDQGYELFEAENGNEGLRQTREHKPDLVILDLMMPDKWGYSVCEELKQDPDTKDTRVLFLTARRSAPSQRLGEIRGGDDYIIKPFTPNELREKVKKLLGLE